MNVVLTTGVRAFRWRFRSAHTSPILEAAMPMTPLQSWIVTENIARFQEQLKAETDESQRKLLETLLLKEQDRARAQTFD